MGGSGKTPHIIYLYRLLEKYVNMATLSRGYGRKTKGCKIAQHSDTVSQIGDEPMIFLKNLPKATVAVAKNRLKAIKQIIDLQSDMDVVLLDDAYQYLKLKPGLSILLTDYYHSYHKDFVFPVGHLREPRVAAKDADIIIVTKSPKVLLPMDREYIMQKIKPLPHQKVYFSYISFCNLCPLTTLAENICVETLSSVVAVAGIANPYPFVTHIKNNYSEVQTCLYADHHIFQISNVKRWRFLLERSLSKNKAIIVTEKDAMRLLEPDIVHFIEDLPIFYLPIEIKFHQSDEELFNNQILNYVADHYRTDNTNS
jgi:tetraacyldisaccharide 4'-kinase